MKGEKNKTKQKYPKFKCNAVSVSPSASGVVVLSKEKSGGGVWGQLYECLLEAVAHLPPTVSHLLLQALFV
jgi:hypothetical protein